MINKNYIIETNAKFSDDNLKRYFLQKTWYTKEEYNNKNLFHPKTAVFILINPSKDNGQESDQTIMTISNYILDKGYNLLIILNLFPYMATKFKDIPIYERKIDTCNDTYIKEICKNNDFIILACGTYTTGVRFSMRKHILDIIEPYKEKVFCFSDSNNFGYHPRTIHSNWKLTKYPFK